jgi:glycosyltransferase involved in cell wall biosynthesis
MDSIKKIKIAAFYPNYFHIKGIAYASLSVMEAMQSNNVQTSLMGIASVKDVTHAFYRDAIPKWLKSVAYRLLSDKQLNSIAESRFAQSLAPSDIVYIWPPVSLALHKKLCDRGHKIIMEFFNTHQATSKAILDAEYKRIGLLPGHGIAAENGAIETEKSQLVDYIFSCSPNVTKSLLNANVPKDKILETSYGLSQSDIFASEEFVNRSKTNEINAIFVGTIGVRKGPHLLLDYWCKSGVKGKLTLVGNIQAEFLPIVEPYLKRQDIKHVPYVMDLKPIYKDADVFMFPSLEEGSPLVTYMALGAGLPCIVSPMGAGGVVEHDVEGMVIEPHDADAWVNAIKKIAEDKNMREKYAKNAHNKAPNYLWAKVGQQRTALLLSRMSSKG